MAVGTGTNPVRTMTASGEPETIRLNLFLSRVGVASRRSCDEIIASGKVRVNGRTVRSPGARIAPGKDDVRVQGDPVIRPARPTVLLLHKPTGVVSTVSDPQGRPTVIDLCRGYRRGRRLFPVGRLDVNTTGALLITNDGLLCYRLTHPRFGIARTYQVRVRGNCGPRIVERLRRLAGAAGARGGRRRPRPARPGQKSPEGPRPAVRLVKAIGKESVLRVTLTEGRNRQVRRLCEQVGLRVVKLKRLSFGPVSVRGLPLGSVRTLEKSELEELRRASGAGG